MAKIYQILLLSGIGTREDLYEVGIQPKFDLPGVGKNLEDHLVSTHRHLDLQAKTNHLTDNNRLCLSSMKFLKV